MARSRRTVSYFAQRSRIAPSEALARLRAAGIPVRRETDVLPKSKVLASEIALGLARPRIVPKEEREERRLDRRHRRQARLAAQRERTAAQRDAVRSEPRRRDLIGKDQHLFFLTVDDLEKMHWTLVEDFSKSRDPISPPGVKDAGLLASALTRCQTCHGRHDKYPTAPMAGAALMHSLIHNHPFHNGNKRTALVGLLVFLDKNGWTLTVEQDPLFDFLLNIGRHGIVDRMTTPSYDFADAEVGAIAKWLARHIKRTEAPHKHLKFRELRSILQHYGCTFDQTSGGSKLNIHRNGRRTQVAYYGDGRDVDLDSIAKIRRDLELDEVHGYDTDIFYGAEERLPEFITKYRKTLDRLAKM
jgi:death-on-curing family protein